MSDANRKAARCQLHRLVRSLAAHHEIGRPKETSVVHAQSAVPTESAAKTILRLLPRDSRKKPTAANPKPTTATAGGFRKPSDITPNSVEARPSNTEIQELETP